MSRRSASRRFAHIVCVRSSGPVRSRTRREIATSFVSASLVDRMSMLSSRVVRYSTGSMAVSMIISIAASHRPIERKSRCGTRAEPCRPMDSSREWRRCVVVVVVGVRAAHLAVRVCSLDDVAQRHVDVVVVRQLTVTQLTTITSENALFFLQRETCQYPIESLGLACCRASTAAQRRTRTARDARSSALCVSSSAVR
jgi:hypothetical protein